MEEERDPAGKNRMQRQNLQGPLRTAAQENRSKGEGLMRISMIKPVQRRPKFSVGDNVVYTKGADRFRDAVVQYVGSGDAFISENNEPVYVISFLPAINATVYEKDLLPRADAGRAAVC